MPLLLPEKSRSGGIFSGRELHSGLFVYDFATARAVITNNQHEEPPMLAAYRQTTERALALLFVRLKEQKISRRLAFIF